MAGIKNAMQDILSKLSLLQVQNQDGSVVAIPTVRVWNNQVNYIREGKLEGTLFPAVYLEIQNQTRYETIGEQVRSADITAKLHLVHSFYNADDGTYEQDLLVFDIRDKVLALLTQFQPAGCGPLFCIVEEQDYTHDNIYHYIMDFICNFTDYKASKDDPGSDAYIDSPAPLDVNVTSVALANNLDYVPNSNGFIIPTR